MPQTTTETEDRDDATGMDNTDDGDQVPELPTDQELAEYFRETRDMDRPPTWVEYFGFEDGTSKEKRDLDDRVREFMMAHVGPQPDAE